MDPEIVEFPPPPGMFKHKEIDLGLIEIEDDNDSLAMFFDRKNKGKSVKFESDGYNERVAEGAGLNLFGSSGEQGSASTNGVDSSKRLFEETTSNMINIDDHSSDESCDYIDDYTDLYLDEDMDIDEYAMLQAHFDNSDIPPGVEAPVPFLLDPHQSNKKPATRSKGLMQSDFVSPNGIDSSSSSKSAESLYSMNYTSHLSQTCPKKKDRVGFNRVKPSLSSRHPMPGPALGVVPPPFGTAILRFPNDMDNANQPTVVDMPSPLSLSQIHTQGKRKVSFAQHKEAQSSSALGVLSKSRWRKPFLKKKQLNSSSSADYETVNLSNGLTELPASLLQTNLPSPPDPSFWDADAPEFPDKMIGPSIGGFHAHHYTGPHMGVFGNHFVGKKDHHHHHHHHGVGLSSLPHSKANQFKAAIYSGITNSNFDSWGSSFFPPYTSDVSWFKNFNHSPKSEFAVPNFEHDVQGPAISSVEKAEALKQFQVFKKFDTVEDFSDNHYENDSPPFKQYPKPWAKRIQEEWKILEKDLPDNIFVRVYESRMDLLRAVIVGAEGTPYHDGLFFFDVHFPDSYPNVPPLVHYRSGGLRLNPNLYNNGKVCLSLLNTWSGSKNEKWLPGTSTMLQVLVSIQALILNAKPYFNEPGYAHMAGSFEGEKKSQHYNENTFILSLKTMTYSIRNPPKYFEEFSMGHFITHGHDILVACKAYMEGAQVGCLVKGGVQDVDEGDQSSSKGFKDILAGYLRMLVKEFTRIGVEDCDQYLPPHVAASAAAANGTSSSSSGNTSRNALRLLSISG